VLGVAPHAYQKPKPHTSGKRLGLGCSLSHRIDAVEYGLYAPRFTDARLRLGLRLHPRLAVPALTAGLTDNAGRCHGGAFALQTIPFMLTFRQTQAPTRTMDNIFQTSLARPYETRPFPYIPFPWSVVSSSHARPVQVYRATEPTRGSTLWSELILMVRHLFTPYLCSAIASRIPSTLPANEKMS